MSNQPSPPPAPPLGEPISLDQACRALEAARRKSESLDVPSAVAIVEPNGELVLFARMPGAPYSATELAQKKAACAARYRRRTDFFLDQINAGQMFFLTFPGVMAAPGGVPLLFGGKLIGALGVSGGNREQDLAMSDAGASVLAEP